MALKMRKGIWHWRKMVDGVQLKRSTRTDDFKLAEQMARKWDHEAVQAIVYEGERPVTLHEAIDGFLNARKHLKSYRLACQHMLRWKKAMPNVPMTSLQKHKLQAVVTKRLADGCAQNTVAVFVVYWNALVNYCTQQRLSTGPKLDRVKSKQTRFRVITIEEEAAMAPTQYLLRPRRPMRQMQY